MAILYTPRMQFVQQSGFPYAFATAQFYATGTTTPIVIYSDSDLMTTQTNPMTADSKGLFPAVFLDDNAEARLVVKNQGGSVTILDVDPVNAILLIGAAQIEDGAIETKLGYTPVDPANAVFTAPARLNYSAPTTVYTSDAVGYLGSPVNIQDENYVLTLDDSGKLLVHDDTTPFTWTIPPHSDVAFPVGHGFWASVTNTGTITIQRGVAVALRIAGLATDDDIVLAQYSFVYFKQVATDYWVMFGVPSASTVLTNANHELALGDNGNTFVHNDANPYAYTIDPHSTTPYPVGFTFSVYSTGAGTVTVTRGSGVALRKAGSSTNANIAVAQWGAYIIKQVEQDSWMAIGAG